MRTNKVGAMLVLLVISFGLILSGCGGGGVVTGSANETGTEFHQTPQFTWRMQVIHNAGQSDFIQNQQTAEEIYKATNGRLKIEVHPNGMFAGSMEAFQACGDGVFEMHSSWPSYLKGIEYAFLPMSTGNMAMDAIDKYVWIYEAGGWELLQKAFDKVNLKLLAVEIWGTEVMNANEPFTSITDMKGKTMRTSDPRLLEKNGVAAITLPLEEVFTALATGAVDAVEFGNLDYNKGLGLTDITKYSIWPDFWNVHFVTTVVVNNDAWNKLSPDIQMIVENAFKAREFQHFTKSQYLSAMTMKELKENGKMEFIRMKDEQFVDLRRQMYEIEQEDIKQHGGLTAATYESLYSFMEDWYPYKDIARWWGIGLTPEEQLGYNP